MLNNPEEEINNEETALDSTDSDGTTEEALVDAEAEPEAVEGETSEAEEEAESDAEESVSDADLVVELDGEEVTIADIKEARKAAKDIKSFQADYTKKTTEAAEIRKQAEAKVAAVSESLEMLESLEADISSLAKSRFEGIDLVDLRDHDPSEYLKVKEQIESSDKFLDNLRAKHQKAKDAIVTKEAAEVRSLLGWEGNPEKVKADTATIEGYLAEKGVSGDMFYRPGGAKMLQIVLEAAESVKLKSSFEHNKKTAETKRKAAPVKTIKPTKKTAEKPKAKKEAWELMYAT